MNVKLMTPFFFYFPITFFVTALIFTYSLIGCSSADKLKADTAEGAYEIGQKYEKDERYEEAIVQYNEVANKHPYSKLALEAKLRVADIYFKKENYIEAQTSYQLFKELHPRHPKIDYVTFRLGLSFFHQLPDTIDRDLSIAHKAILYFNEVIKSYPSGSFVSEAEKYRAKSLKMLSEKELYIAHFYFIRDQYDSALGRYEGLIHFDTSSEDLSNEDKFKIQALYGAALSAYHLKDQTKAEQYYQSLTAEFPQSDEAKKIKQEMKHE